MTIIKPSIILLLSLFTANSLLFGQEPEQTPSSTEKANSTTPTGTEDLLDKQVPADEKVWLSTKDGPQIAFYIKETSGNDKGGVLLIPDTNLHPTTSKLIDSLRYNLARNSWHTLAIKVGDTNEEQTQQLIVAGINELNKRGVYNIAILGEGAGAAMAMAYVASNPTPEPTGQNTPKNSGKIRAVLLLDGRNQISNSDIAVLELFKSIKVPILDAFLNNDYQKQQYADQRKQAALRQTNKRYQQVLLPQVANINSTEDNLISKRIRGWLDKNAVGFMIDR